AAEPGGSPTAVTTASSRAGTNQDRRWRIGDHGQNLTGGSTGGVPSRQGQSGCRRPGPGAGESGKVAGDAAVPAPGPADLVAFAGLKVQLDLEGVGVAAQVQPGAGGAGRLRPLARGAR